MKNFKHFMFAVVALVMGVAFVSCETDPTGEPGGGTKVEVKVAAVDAGGATIEVVTRGISEFAYMDKAGKELSEVAILGAGEKKTIEAVDAESVTTVQIYGLEPGSTNDYYFAFRKSDNALYGEVVKVEITTTNIQGALTVVDRRYDGFAVHVQVPDEVKARGNALRYSSTSLAMYNFSKIFKGGLEIDMLLYNSGVYTKDDVTARYDSYNSYERDEDGNIIPDGAAYADPKVPGEPGVFLVGEYSWMEEPDEHIIYIPGENAGEGKIETIIAHNPSEDKSWDKESDEYKKAFEQYLYYLDSSVWTYPAGWKPGYYRPEFDWLAWAEAVKFGAEDYDSEKYWLGYYDRIQVDTLEPDTLKGNVSIKVRDPKPIDAIVELTPSEDVMFYQVMIMLESEYQAQFLPLIDNNEDYARWFTGSYFGMYTFGADVFDGATDIYLSEWFVDNKALPGQEIRILVAGMGDNEGKTQCFNTMTYKMPEITKSAPVVVVEPIATKDPYVAMFNIKAPNKDAYEVYYACNYIREFDAAIKGTSYLEFMKSIEGAGNAFSANEIAEINSDKGYTFMVASRENETTRLAVLVYNDEGTHNKDLNESGTTSVAETKTVPANYPTQVNSDLFAALVGEWEATAPMQNYVADTDAEGNVTGYHWEAAGTMTSPVTIAAGVEYPETLPAEVYEIYKKGGVDRDEVDELYEEFVKLAKDYNDRTRGFNRLLCLGYNFAGEEYMLDDVATPYDLFIAEDYSASQISYMFYDFGPKWNLEIDAQGNVSLPIDISREFPLETWSFGLDQAIYMLAVGEKSYLGAPWYDKNGNITLDSRFPVEVSADRNTLTIKPFKYTSPNDGSVETYYPCIAQVQYGQAVPLNPRICGDVVLKRKSATTSAATTTIQSNGVAPAVYSMGEAPIPVERVRSVTPMQNIEIRKAERYVRDEKIEMGAEAYQRRAQEYIEKTYGISLD